MNPNDWEELNELYHSLLALSESEREERLLALSTESPQLVTQVRGMLGGTPPEGFMDPPDSSRALGAFLGVGLEGRVLGGFRIDHEVGRGGMGIVYAANQVAFDREVALKILPPFMCSDPQTAERFKRESLAASKVEHENVAAVIAAGESDGILYYAMEFVRGEKLADVLADAQGRKRFSVPSKAASTFAMVARALEAAHAEGVVHRDISPQNILVDADDKLRIIDFGLALLHSSPRLTRTGTVAGTPHYMSPEQASASLNEIDHRTDIYSVGVLMYEMLTGTLPFAGEELHEVLQLVIRGQVERPRRRDSSIPLELELICLRALDRDPGARYQAAGDLADDLERFVQGRPISLRPESFGKKCWRGVRRTLRDRRSIGAILVVATALMTVLALAVAEHKRAEGSIELEFVGSDKARLYLQELGPEPWQASALELFQDVEPGDRVVLTRLPGRRRFVLTDDAGGQAELTRDWSAGSHAHELVSLPLARANAELERLKCSIPRTEIHILLKMQNEDGVYVERWRTYVVDPFAIDRACVTNAEYQEFLRGSESPLDLQDKERDWVSALPLESLGLSWCALPATKMTSASARAYAESRGMRLPTFLEWLAAISVNDSAWDGDVAEQGFVIGERDLLRGRSMPAYLRFVEPADSGNQSTWGVVHPVGNVMQWLDHAVPVLNGDAIVASDFFTRMQAGSCWNTPDTFSLRELAMFFGMPAPVPYEAAPDCGIRCVSSLLE